MKNTSGHPHTRHYHVRQKLKSKGKRLRLIATSDRTQSEYSLKPRTVWPSMFKTEPSYPFQTSRDLSQNHHSCKFQKVSVTFHHGIFNKHIKPIFSFLFFSLLHFLHFFDLDNEGGRPREGEVSHLPVVKTKLAFAYNTGALG